jgi:hypothetical protein
MYVCSDLKVEVSKINKNNNDNYRDKVGMFSPQNLKSNIGNLKKSVEKKLDFISTYQKYSDSNVFKKNSKFLKKNKSNLDKILKEDSKVSVRLELDEKKTKILDGEEIISNEKLNRNESYSLPPLIKKRPIFQKDSLLISDEKEMLASSNMKVKKKYRESLSFVSMHMIGPDDNKEDIKEFNKVFQKNLNDILEIKSNKNKYGIIVDEERQRFAQKSRINDQIVKMKDKIHFMKGVIDYCYPKIMIEKFKVLGGKHTIENENSKNSSLISKSPISDNTFMTNLQRNITGKNSPQKNKSLNSKNMKIVAPIHIRSVSNFI